jgi:hypothetical protein
LTGAAFGDAQEQVSQGRRPSCPGLSDELVPAIRVAQWRRNLLFCRRHEPPGALVLATDKARDMLSESRRGEAIYPKRARQRQQLVTLQTAIAFVRKAMRNPTISATLMAGDNHFHNQNEMDHGLADLAKRAATAIGEIPPGGGRNKFYAQPDGLSPQVKCALMVRVFWTRVHGTEPPSDNETAKQACFALWRAATGGAPKDGERPKKRPKNKNVTVKAAGCGPDRCKDGESVAVWRDHLQAAKRAANSKEAEFIRRALAPPAARPAHCRGALAARWLQAKYKEAEGGEGQ